MTPPQPVDQLIGRKLRDLRTELGITQEDVAREAGAHGLAWTRDTVASLERARRDLSLAELFLLPRLFAAITGKSFGLVDFIPAQGRAALTGSVTLPAQELIETLQGAVESRRPRRRLMPMELTPERANPNEMLADFRLLRNLGWRTLSPEDRAKAARESFGVAERTAATRFDVAPIVVVLASWQLWKKSLTAERDRLLRSRGNDERSVKAIRAEITRELYKMLEPTISGARPRSGQ